MWAALLVMCVGGIRELNKLKFLAISDQQGFEQGH